MKTYEITSPQNKTFKIFEEILNSAGINKNFQAFISGRKLVNETLSNFPQSCLGLILSGKMEEADFPKDLALYILSPDLFKILDVFGSRQPLLLVRVPVFKPWVPGSKGCQLLVPFQEPSNVGAVLRSAAAFGVKDILLTSGSAHPFHPKSARASSGSVFTHTFSKVPPLEETHFENIATIALDLNGENISDFKFPRDFILIPGVEGPGLPKNLKPTHRITIPTSGKVESLNGPTAVAIALFTWYSVLSSCK